MNRGKTINKASLEFGLVNNDVAYMTNKIVHSGWCKRHINQEKEELGVSL